MDWLDQFDIDYAKAHPELDDAPPSALKGEVTKTSAKLIDSNTAFGAPKSDKKDWLAEFNSNYLPKETPQRKLSTKERIEQIKKEPIPSVGETPWDILKGGASIASGMLASSIAGWKGMLSDTPTKSIQETQQALTYQPTSEGAKKVVNFMGAPIEYGAEKAGQLGGYVGGKLGNELAGEAIGEASIPMAATVLMGASGLKSAKGVQTPSLPNVPVLSTVIKGARDVARTKTVLGKEKLAQEYLQKLTTPEEATKIVTALESGKEIVPSSPVTSADAIAQANRASIISGNPDRFGAQYVALQEGLSKLPETSAELVKVKLQQEYARNSVLEQGAGSDVVYSNAIDIRKANAAKNYSNLYGEKLVADTELSNLLNRPSMEIATSIAESLAKEKGEVFQLAKSTPEIVTERYNPLTMMKEKVSIPPQFAEYNTQSLQYMKLALDKMVSKPTEYGITSAQVAAISKTRASLINWIENKSKTYAMANKAYSIDSLPIQQMDLWRLLKEKYQSPTGKESPGVYMRMLRDETKAIKEATGWQKSTGFDDIFNTEQSALANRLAVEMENNLVKDRMASEVTGLNVGNPTKGIEPSLPNMLMREAMIANFLLKHLAQKANIDVNIAAARILKDPVLLANTLKQVKPANRPSILQFIKKSATSKESLGIGMVTSNEINSEK